MTMKVGSSLAAFTLFGKSIALSLKSDAQVETDISLESWQLNDDCCEVYNDRYFSGDRQEICVDKSDAGHGDNSSYQYRWGAIQSWRCGKNTHISFCPYNKLSWVEGIGYTCDGKEPEISSAGRIDNPISHWWRWQQDWLFKSAGVQAYDFKNHGGPVTFTDRLHDGTCMGHTSLKSVGSSNEQTQFEMNDWFRGIAVPYGYQVKLYDIGSALKGEYIGNVDDQGRMKCESWDCSYYKCPDWAIVEKQSDAGAVGHWKFIAYRDEEFSYTYKVGLERQDMKETTKSDTKSLEIALEYGVSFDPPKGPKVDKKITMTAGYSESTSKKAQQVAKQSATSEVTSKCTPEQPKSGVSLYQWVVDTKDYIVRDPVAVCRYGKEKDGGPKCPLSACKDHKCEECEDDWSAGYL